MRGMGEDYRSGRKGLSAESALNLSVYFARGGRSVVSDSSSIWKIDGRKIPK